jgi:hypothetical protein
VLTISACVSGLGANPLRIPTSTSVLRMSPLIVGSISVKKMCQCVLGFMFSRAQKIDVTMYAILEASEGLSRISSCT